MKIILELNNVTIAYGSTRVVRDVSFDVKKAGITVIVGESGSGKSTLLRSIVNLLDSQGKIISGELFFQGERLDVKHGSTKEMRAIRGNKIAMIFQHASVYLDGRRKIETQFIEGIRCHQQVTVEEARTMAKIMLLEVGLEDVDRIMMSYSFELSGGMCQRVAIAMAMVNHPKLLLADEPTSSLDVTTQMQVVNQMLKLVKEHKTAIILVTHDIGLAAYIADEIVVMKEGRVVEWGTRDQVITRPNADYTKHLIHMAPRI